MDAYCGNGEMFTPCCEHITELTDTKQYPDLSLSPTRLSLLISWNSGRKFHSTLLHNSHPNTWMQNLFINSLKD